MHAAPPIPETLREALRQDCLSLETLAALHDGTLDATRAGECLAHIGHCESCAAEWSLMLEFVEATPDAGEAAAVESIVRQVRPEAVRPEPVAPFWARLFPPMFPKLAGALALVILTVGLGLLQRPRPAGLEPPSADWRAGQALQVLTQGDLAAVPSSLRWTAVSGAAAYEVSIREVDRTLLWSAEATAASMPLPAFASAFLLPGKTVMLQVRALDSTGALLAESEPARLRIVPSERTR